MLTCVARAIVKLTSHIKVRTYAKTSDEMWLDEWRSPLRVDVAVTDGAAFEASLRDPVRHEDPNFCYVDKLETGFLVWQTTVKGYRPVGPGPSAFSWEPASQPVLQAMREVITDETFFKQLATLLGQESSKNPATLKLRAENTSFIKSLCKPASSELFRRR